MSLGIAIGWLLWINGMPLIWCIILGLCIGLTQRKGGEKMSTLTRATTPTGDWAKLYIDGKEVYSNHAGREYPSKIFEIMRNYKIDEVEEITYDPGDKGWPSLEEMRKD